MEIRCAYKKHGEVFEPAFGILEVKCTSRFCGAGNGTIVLHRFDLTTSFLIETLAYKNPNKGE